jgi:hypothetical protein
MTTEQRLERLERENKWMRRIGVVAVAVAATVFLIGQGKEKALPDLKAKSLELIDESGKRWLFAGSKKEMASFGLYDTNGAWFFVWQDKVDKQRNVELRSDNRGFVNLTASDEQVGLYVHDSQTLPLIGIYTDDKEKPVIGLQSKDGSPGVKLSVDKPPYLEVGGPSGKTLFQVPAKK